MTAIPYSLFLQHGDVSTAIKRPANFDGLVEAARACFGLVDKPNVCVPPEPATHLSLTFRPTVPVLATSTTPQPQ